MRNLPDLRPLELFEAYVRGRDVSDHQNALFLWENRPALITTLHRCAGSGREIWLTSYSLTRNRWSRPYFISIGGDFDEEPLRLATDEDPCVTYARETLVWMDTMLVRVVDRNAIGGSYERAVNQGDLLVAPELDAVRVAMPGETADWLCVRQIPGKSQVQVAPMWPREIRSVQ